MKCLDCPADAAPDRVRCAQCLAHHRARARSYRQHKGPDLSKEYPKQFLPYDQAEVQAAYDKTPPQRRALLFWDRLAQALGRSGGAVYSVVHRKWGWAAKVIKVERRCKKCDGVLPKYSKNLLCRSCWRKMHPGTKPPGDCVDCGKKVARYPAKRCAKCHPIYARSREKNAETR